MNNYIFLLIIDRYEYACKNNHKKNIRYNGIKSE